MAALWDNPYCGSAPIPADLIARWNLDPVLLVAMTGLACLHLWSLHQSSELREKRWRVAAMWLALAALFVSPLCALSSALFSVRVAHHVALIALVAPLLVLSLPAQWRSVAWTAGPLFFLFIVHVASVWIWHAPAPYVWALSSHAVFWLMQISLLATSALLWLTVLAPGAPLGSAVTLLVSTATQMSLLGAVITFARAPLYVPHFATTEPYGLTAFADQQLAGLIMWVPAALPYLAAALVLTGQRLARADLADRAS